MNEKRHIGDSNLINGADLYIMSLDCKMYKALQIAKASYVKGQNKHPS